MSLEAWCRAFAERVPGAKAFPGGGLRFRRGGFEGRVEFGARSWDVIFDTHDLPVEPLELSPAGLWHDVRGLFGFQDAQVGDADFDAAFERRTASPDFAASLLKPWLRKRLRELAIHGGFRWRLTRAGFLLRLEGRPASEADLERGMTAAFDLLDVLPGAHGRERVRMGEARTKIVEDTTCGVRGVTLAQGALVRRESCRTPHHADCWSFNGRCSIFACGSLKAS